MPQFFIFHPGKKGQWTEIIGVEKLLKKLSYEASYLSLFLEIFSPRLVSGIV